MAMTTSCGYEPMRSGTTILCYINRDGLPLSDRCTERMWSFCMEQYAKTSLVKPAGTLITSSSVPTRLQSVSIRQNRGASLNCRQSALSKTPTTIIHEENSTDKDQAVSYAIRV
ncbi:unnamed protein product [Rotaria socialis]|uniref:Uncharacterized protein n=1 Tax=Rotaria socialis TaxID=392032 RepID=A0A820Y4B1_9BILA|nr:unnamed protein product [Rotaria socialis]